jgi:hypothetical protein
MGMAQARESGLEGFAGDDREKLCSQGFDEKPIRVASGREDASLGIGTKSGWRH